MNRAQGLDAVPIRSEEPRHESLLYSPRNEVISVEHGKQCFIEVIDEVALVAEKFKERFADGVQVADFLSLGKTLLLDGDFRKEAWRIFSNLGHLKPVFWNLKNSENKEIALHAKTKFSLLIKK